MLAYQRTAKHWDNAFLIAMMILAVKQAVFQPSKTNTLNAHARLIKMLNQLFDFIKEKCPLGCPCDGYDCDLPEKKAILTLYSRTSSTPPVFSQPDDKYL